jgi:carbonic anhydrase
MSIIDKALEANRNCARNYNPTLGTRPIPKIAVVTCMDPRLSDLPGILGLPHADLDVSRAGGPAGSWTADSSRNRAPSSLGVSVAGKSK